MKEKFDFTAEMAEAESIKSNPKHAFLEEESRLLDHNVQELAKLNDNVCKLRTEVEDLTNSIREYKPFIAEEMQKLTTDYGATLLCKFINQIDSKCKEAERRMKKAEHVIPIPTTAFYIAIILLITLFAFFVGIIVANAEIIHSAWIWKTVIGCSFAAFISIAITIYLPRILNK